MATIEFHFNRYHTLAGTYEDTKTFKEEQGVRARNLQDKSILVPSKINMILLKCILRGRSN